MAKEIFIFGAGTYGAAIGELAESCGYEIIGFFDDDASKIGKRILGKPVIGKLGDDAYSIKGKNFALAIGNNSVRVKKSEHILANGGNLPSLIHPKAEISKYAKVGKACIVHALSFVWTEAAIGDFTIISPNVVIAHHTIFGTGSFISTGCSIGAGIGFGIETFVGIGATVMTGVKKIGDRVTIGAGSVVISDIEDCSIVAGVPAKLIKKV